MLKMFELIIIKHDEGSYMNDDNQDDLDAIRMNISMKSSLML